MFGDNRVFNLLSDTSIDFSIVFSFVHYRDFLPMHSGVEKRSMQGIGVLLSADGNIFRGYSSLLLILSMLKLIFIE